MSRRKEGGAPRDAKVFLRLNEDERRRLKVVCAAQGVSYAEFIMRAVARAEPKPVGRSPLHVDPEDENW